MRGRGILFRSSIEEWGFFMSVTFEIEYTTPRSRVTTFFRYILAIPHLVCVGVLGWVANLLGFVQWLIILFTGKRNRGIWDFQRGVWDWSVRTLSYLSLMYDAYPNFGFVRRDEPVTTDIVFVEQANRLTCALRIIWVIPAAIVTMVVGIAGYVLMILSWFAILFTGSHPRGMFDFMLRSQRMWAHTNAYAQLLTDDYPRFT